MWINLSWFSNTEFRDNRFGKFMQLVLALPIVSLKNSIDKNNEAVA